MSFHVYFPFYEFASPPSCTPLGLSGEEAGTTGSLDLLLGL